MKLFSFTVWDEEIIICKGQQKTSITSIAEFQQLWWVLTYCTMFTVRQAAAFSLLKKGKKVNKSKAKNVCILKRVVLMQLLNFYSILSDHCSLQCILKWNFTLKNNALTNAAFPLLNTICCMPLKELKKHKQSSQLPLFKKKTNNKKKSYFASKTTNTMLSCSK